MSLQINPALDVSYIDQVYGEDPMIIHMIFDAFLSDSVPRWVALKTALNNKDLVESASIVHGLKPSFTMAGLTWIRPKVEILEKAIKVPEDWDALTLIYNRISDELNQLLPIIENESERLKKM